MTRGNTYKNLHTPSPEIISKRKKIEKELSNILEKSNSDFTLREIQDIIYNETEMDDFHRIIRMFDAGLPYELENVIETINDA